MRGCRDRKPPYCMFLTMGLSSISKTLLTVGAEEQILTFAATGGGGRPSLYSYLKRAPIMTAGFTRIFPTCERTDLWQNLGSILQKKISSNSGGIVDIRTTGYTSGILRHPRSTEGYMPVSMEDYTKYPHASSKPWYRSPFMLAVACRCPLNATSEWYQGYQVLM